MKKYLLLLLLVLLYPVGYFVLENDPNFTLSQSAEPHKGVGVYLINMDRSKERYAHVLPYIQRLGLPFERITAVEGAALSDQEINQIIELKSFYKSVNCAPKKGTIGCSLSHIKTWQQFLNSGFEYAIVFEDDISFDPAVLRSVIASLLQLTNDWDVVSFEMGHKGNPLTIKSLPNDQKLSVYLTEVTHTGCYMLNRKAAARYLEKAFPIKMPIDHYFTRGWEFGLKFTGVENPRLVHQALETSEISKTGQVERKEDSPQVVMYGLFKAQTFLIRIWYTFTEWLVHIL